MHVNYIILIGTCCDYFLIFIIIILIYVINHVFGQASVIFLVLTEKSFFVTNID